MSQQFAQVIVMLSQLAAVITGGDEGQTGAACGGVQTGSHRSADRIGREAVDHQFVDRSGAGRQFAAGQSDQRRAIGIVGAGLQFFVTRANFAAGSDDPAGERQYDIGDFADRGGGGFRGEQCLSLIGRTQQ